MQCEVFFKKCSKALKSDIEEYWEHKLPRLERLLAKFSPEPRSLRLGVSQRGNEFEGRAVLVLPSATLVATTVQTEYDEALDQVADILGKEIRKHRDSLNREIVERRRRSQRDDWLRAGNQLQADHEGDRRDDFFELIRPLLRSLQHHARRELVLCQLRGELPAGYTTVSELVDEAVVLAWDRFGERPDHIPLESWLVTLVHEVVQGMCDDGRSLPLSQRVADDDPRFEIENGWLRENEPFWADVRPLRYQDVLPSQDVSESLDHEPRHEQELTLLGLLSEVEPECGRTFTLHVLEGWEEEEIAMFQGRSCEAVREDIESVRSFLRDRSRA